MPTTKVAISLETEVLERLDELVEAGTFPNRSRAIQQAVEEKLDRLERGRLARECAKLDPSLEAAMAEEGLSSYPAPVFGASVHTQRRYP
jgi:Arc/MetJ-type ribon-helix-helix transcriptional regulator